MTAQHSVSEPAHLPVRPAEIIVLRETGNRLDELTPTPHDGTQCEQGASE